MRRSERMRASEIETWIVLALALVFAGLAFAFWAWPAGGAALFGLVAETEGARAYLRAVAIRDLALAGYMIALLRLSTRRALAVLTAVTVVIPVCDLALLAIETGGLTLFHALVHGASALVFAALSWRLFAIDRAARRPEV